MAISPLAIILRERSSVKLISTCWSSVSSDLRSGGNQGCGKLISAVHSRCLSAFHPATPAREGSKRRRSSSGARMHRRKRQGSRRTARGSTRNWACREVSHSAAKNIVETRKFLCRVKTFMAHPKSLETPQGYFTHAFELCILENVVYLFCEHIKARG